MLLAHIEFNVAMADEQTIWKGSASAILNLRVYLLCGLLAVGWCVLCFFFRTQLDTFFLPALGLAVLPVLYGLARHILLRSREYEVTTERIRIRSGLFSKRTDEVELYRIKDYTLIEPFWQRLAGVGSVVLATHDQTTPTVTIEAVHGARALHDEIRKNVEICREKKHVRLAELE